MRIRKTRQTGYRGYSHQVSKELTPIRWAVVLLLASGSVHAQTLAASDEQEPTLEVQRVEATAAPSIRSELAQTTQIIDTEQLQQQVQGGKSLSEALGQLVPGVD